jgi:hypothetical protein
MYTWQWGQMYSIVFWDVTSCSPLKALKVSWSLAGVCSFHLQRQNISRAGGKLHWYLAWHIVWPWNPGWYIPPKCQLTFYSLDAIISQKMALFMTTTVRTWEHVIIRKVQFWKCCLLNMIKSRSTGVGKAYSMHGERGGRRMHIGLWWENQKERDH